MCLAVLALDLHPRYAVVLASNRDEYHERPTAALSAWSAPEVSGPVYGGRDLQAGGTWLALGPTGRLALLTNVRRPWPVDSAASPTPSRGQLALDWLAASCPPEVFWAQQVQMAYAPFNLLLGDAVSGGWFWGSNVSPDHPGRAPQNRRLAVPGLYGLSNAALDTPWPKLQRLKQQVWEALVPERPASQEVLIEQLFAALADRHQPPDETLPHTGVGLVLERLLAPVFIHDPRRIYGTRASTVLLVERCVGGQPASAHLLERRFGPDGQQQGQTALAFSLPPPGPSGAALHAKPAHKPGGHAALP